MSPPLQMYHKAKLLSPSNDGNMYIFFHKNFKLKACSFNSCAVTVTMELSRSTLNSKLCGKKLWIDCHEGSTYWTLCCSGKEGSSTVVKQLAFN